jgi:tetratricopeptide (TPR) repeat protein
VERYYPDILIPHHSIINTSFSIFFIYFYTFKTKLLGGKMKTLTSFIITLTIIFSTHMSFSQTINEYIQKAESFNQSGDLEQAATIMEEAIQKYPDNPLAYSYLGLYRGTQAGQTQNYMEAGELIGISYEMLDKAVSLDPDNPVVRFHRGLMGIKIPTFMNKLDQGIQDLEFLINIHQKSPEKVSTEIMASAYNFLGEGYQKKEEKQKAINAWEEVIKLAPDTDLSKNAQKNISKMTQPKKTETVEEKKYTLEDVDKIKHQIENDPDNLALSLQLGKAYIDTKNFKQAEKTLREVIQKDSTNVDAYKLLLRAIGEMVAKGYDERIYENSNLRSELAFEIVKVADRAVEVAPDDLELRLVRGEMGVMMPFFVGKLEQAIKDLELVRKGDVADETKAEAIYWFGVAYQKKAITNWIEVITDYSETNASQLAFESMRPAIKHFDATKYQRPFLVIDFILGFRDELSPQTAVWIEDQNGKYIKTIYVSGFSGFVKEKQVNLSEWAESSQFKDVDAVTAASIDVGHHIYLWDLKDTEAKKVKNGEYIVKVETAYWPSMEYQLSSARIKIGEKDDRLVVEEGNIIPYMEVKYFSGK